MARWVAALPAGRVRPGFGKFVRVEGRDLAVFNDGGEYYTVDDTCPHQGASLAEGFLHQGRVVCPWHSWAFDVRTGACPRVPHISVGAYPTRVVGESVEVQLPDPRVGEGVDVVPAGSGS